jgi:ribonuclease HI
VFVGYAADLGDQFDVPHKKAIGRLRKFSPTLRILSLQKRIIIMNAFIIPIYMYVGQFFLLPESYGKEMRTLIHQAVGPWGDKGFSERMYYTHHPLRLLPHTCNLWAFNLATTISHIPKDRWQDTSVVPINIEWHTMLISSHADYALHYYIRTCPATGLLPPTHIPTPRHYVLSKKLIYNNLISSHYDSDATKHWEKRISAKINPNTRPNPKTANLLLLNYKLASSRVPPYMHNKFVAQLNNAIYTKTRYRQHRAKNSIKLTNDYPCDLCGLDGLDELAHYYNECAVLRAAFALVYNKAPLSFKLLYLQTEADRGEVELLLSFFQAFHNIRALAAAGFATGDAPRLALRIADETSALVDKHFPPLAPKGNKIQKESTQIHEVIAAIPRTAISIYTDGSSFGNPGPSGAGAFIEAPGFGSYYLYEALGHGTNNLGELWGLAMALSFFNKQHFPPDRHVYIMIDSSLALGVIKSGWVARDYPDICKIILDSYRELAIRASPIWVPAHADVTGNEIADRLAKRGSAASRNSPITLPLCIQDCTFREVFIPPTL